MNLPLSPSSSPPRAASRGFNLIEVLVVLAIIAILAAWAAPDFRDSLASKRVRERASALQLALEQARATAIARGVPISIVPDGAAYTDGWRLVVDFDADGAIDAADEPLQVAGPSEDGIAVLASPMGAVTFTALGEPKLGTLKSLSFTVCSRAATRGERRVIDINAAGRIANTLTGLQSC